MGDWDSLQLKDRPGQAPTPMPGGADFGSLWTRPDQQNLGTGLRPTTGLDQQQPIYRPTEQQQPYDATVQNSVRNGTLELKYGDPNMDKLLSQAQNYQTIHIDTPQGVQLKHWVDQNGHFFWFAGGGDNSAKHYYPAFSKAMNVNGQNFDLEAQRLKVDEAFAASQSAAQGPVFQSFTGRTDAMTYFSRMSGLSVQALGTLEKSLANSVATSNNPYFKIYLADVYTAEAMQPIIQQVMRGGNADLNNPETLRRLDSAIQLLQSAQGDSRSGLSRVNMNPPGNVVMPLDPYGIYSNPRDTGHYYGFWGGSLDQARHREVGLTLLRNLISSGALPKIELPPNLPPR
ncbi:hypothetical protein BH10CYA1_BH10CYA1_03010 [soil metagenome]